MSLELSLRDLEYVIAVPDHGSFVRAPGHCTVMQLSLSAQIRRVEGLLGTAIFERTTRGVVVTTKGQLLVNQAGRIVVEASTFHMIVRNSYEPFGGKIRFPAIAMLGPYFFPRFLTKFKGSYPEAKFFLSEGLTKHPVERLVSGDLDELLLSVSLSAPGVATKPMFQEPFLLAARVRHPSTQATGPSSDELDTFERLLLEHCLQDQALAAYTLRAPRSRHSTRLETLIYTDAAGEGGTAVRSLAANGTQEGVFPELSGKRYSRSIALAWYHSDPRQREISTCFRTRDGRCCEFGAEEVSTRLKCRPTCGRRIKAPALHSAPTAHVPRLEGEGPQSEKKDTRPPNPSRDDTQDSPTITRE